MELTPREKDKLLLFTAALLAERRLGRGLKLNYPEAVALISAAVLEGARDGRSVAELMSLGREVLSRLRDAGRDTPVLMLTARDELPDKIAGFRAGADDYLTKPFHLPELEVRLEALVARARGRGRHKVLQVGDLKLDMGTLEATRAGHALHLYPACRKLLEVLMQASPAAVTRDRLEHALWGDDPPDGDMLRSHIYELRRSVDGPFATKLIQTLPRVGYRIVAGESATIASEAIE